MGSWTYGFRIESSFLAVASFIALLLATSGASAATLDVVGGQLLGASGVDVGGTLYDVAFLDGTCIALFDGCDSVADFPFTSFGAAELASQALLDQVLLDSVVLGLFDSIPSLTNGCEVAASGCLIRTPVDFESSNGFEIVSCAVNEVLDGGGNAIGGDGTGCLAFQPNIDLSDWAGGVYAVWTPVPEPCTGVLFGLGLVTLAIKTRRGV